MNNVFRSAIDVLSPHKEFSFDDSDNEDSELDESSEDVLSTEESSNDEDWNISPTYLLRPSGTPLYQVTLSANAHILLDQTATAMTSLRQQITMAMWAVTHWANVHQR